MFVLACGPSTTAQTKPDTSPPVGVKPDHLACDPAHPELPCTPDYPPE